MYYSSRFFLRHVFYGKRALPTVIEMGFSFSNNSKLREEKLVRCWFRLEYLLKNKKYLRESATLQRIRTFPTRDITTSLQFFLVQGCIANNRSEVAADKNASGKIV